VLQQARASVRAVARAAPRHQQLGLLRWRLRAAELLRRDPVVRGALLLRTAALAVSAKLEIPARV
jgi:hypothetical protein